MRWVLALVVLCACSDTASSEEATPAPTSPTSSSPSPPRSPGSGDGDDGEAHRASAALSRCAEMSGELTTITGAVARLAALPLPAGGPCFVATLPRPLAVVATIGVTSAQPAAGSSSPRLFFLLPKLVISAVPDGDGSKVLELGEWMTGTRTLKGEIELPVTAPLPTDAAFQRVLQGSDRTMCATCHREEAPHPSIPNAFVSIALKPERSALVTLAELEALHETCSRERDPSERCAMLHAVFDFGEVTQGAFAPEVETFF